MSEKSVQASVRKAIKRQWPGAWVFHPVGSPYQEGGIPDLLVCVEGLLIGLELKEIKASESPRRARARTTDLQRAQLRAIVRGGGYGGTVLNPREAVLLIERCLREHWA